MKERAMAAAAAAAAAAALGPLGTGCVGPAPVARLAPEGAALPLYALGSAQVFVEATVWAGAGAPPRQMLWLVDTGARNTALDVDVAERLGLTIEETGDESTGVLGTQPVRRTVLRRLELGAAATLESWPVKVLQITLGVDGDGALPVAGVLGTDLLERFDVTLDVPGGRLFLLPPGTSLRAPGAAGAASGAGAGAAAATRAAAAAGAALGAGAVAVPFDWSSREVLVALRTGGTTETFTVEVDSGAELVLLFRRGAGFPEGWPAELVIGGAGDTDKLRASRVRALTLPDVSLGPLALGAVPAVVLEGPPRAKDGLLGMEVLGRRAVRLDFRGRRLWFGAVSDGPGPADYRARLDERFGRALAADPDDYDANLGLGMLRLTQGRWDEARRLLGWAASLRPREAEAAYRLALAEWGAGELDAALDAATRAAALTGGRPLYDRLVRALVDDLAARRRPPPVRAEVLDLDPSDIEVR
ncbi:MAG TPA: aspartyl protease family protein [Myxococcota bacterium]|nr:aspartyl protease family protein [Myxococcota bacterium]